MPTTGEPTLELRVAVNGLSLAPGQIIDTALLGRAGFTRLPAWRRWLRRLPGGFGYWEAIDPTVHCFDGAVEIYASRQGYLDPDRQWGTALLLCEENGRVQWFDIRVIEGVYSACNFYERFVEAASRQLGEPDQHLDQDSAWQRNGLSVAAHLSDDALHASFHVEWAGAGGNNGGRGATR
jgi:hypothetical protein